MEIFREFTFEAAHRLPNVPAGHKCARLHGHSYRVEVHVTGRSATTSGWVMDFGRSRTRSRRCTTNSITTTSTRSPGWRTRPARTWPAGSGTGSTGALPLSAVVVRETCTSGCVYRGEAMMLDDVQGRPRPTRHLPIDGSG